MKQKLVIAIDGYSSTGKSSISKEIAKRLGLIHIDTGALYRAITWYTLQNCKTRDGSLNLNLLTMLLPKININLKPSNGKAEVFLNGKNVESEIRTIQVSENVSDIAKTPEVRAFLLDTQRKIAENGGVIMDGRDIGSVVLPNADFKFFLTASADERAKRRYLELKNTGVKVSVEEVKRNLLERDKKDSERAIAPLVCTEDAILIDNTHLDKEQSIAEIISHIQ
ncbi:(d)CMP kinase [Riemerella columbipharyngis]|uniref:Cytidylate kinase n=1 Tax=Riemerella columbipharyngis TaxID=1071918 RepID=A0A1G7DA67_9FLAO|nr:(d)CMP kinase [Riemerella columbipharyngis]SDE47880.1 cytidylate kinase [Riemerella columbipharyngis]